MFLEDVMVSVDDMTDDVNVLFRPFIIDFLENVSMYFNIGVITNIERVISDKIIGHIDPRTKYIGKNIIEANKRSQLVEVSKLDKDQLIVVRTEKNAFDMDNVNEIIVSKWIDDKKDEVLLNLMHRLKDIAVCRSENLSKSIKLNTNYARQESSGTKY